MKDKLLWATLSEQQKENLKDKNGNIHLTLSEETLQQLIDNLEVLNILKYLLEIKANDETKSISMKDIFEGNIITLKFNEHTYELIKSWTLRKLI